MNFCEIEQFVLDGWLVLFVVVNFRVHCFFAKKNTHNEKVVFLCMHATEWNSSQKEIHFPFLSKKESHFDPCTYRGFLILHLFHCF